MTTASKLSRYELLLDQIFPLVSPEVRNMIDDARHQELRTSVPHGRLSPTGSASFGVIDMDVTSNSPSAQRVPLSLPSPLTHQHHSSLETTPRTLPTPLLSEISDTPLRPTPGSDSTTRSLTDDQSGAPTLRLPSITRHGFLVEEGSDTLLVPGLSPPLTDALKLDERNPASVGNPQLRMGQSNASPPD